MFLTPLTPTPEAALRDVHASRAEFRLAAARALGALEGQEHAEAAREGLRSLCHDVDARVRLEALRGLLQLGDVSVLPAVLAQTDDPAPGVRAAALLTAEALGCDAQVLLESALTPDPPLQIAALEALVTRSLGRPLPRPAEAPHTRAAAPDPGAAPDTVAAVIQALSDPSQEVRASAAAAIAALGVHAATDALVSRLSDTPRVRASAALALADLGDARSVPALIEELGRGSFEAAEALGNLGVEAAREPLASSAARLFTPLLTKAAAGAALIRLGDPRGEDVLRAVLRAFRPDGRPYAVVQVMQLRLRTLRPELEALLRRPRGVDRDLVRDALAALAPGSPA